MKHILYTSTTINNKPAKLLQVSPESFQFLDKLLRISVSHYYYLFKQCGPSRCRGLFRGVATVSLMP